MAKGVEQVQSVNPSRKLVENFQSAFGNGCAFTYSQVTNQSLIRPMSMNPYISKKLGEVLAFAEVGLDTLEKGKDAYLAFLENKKIEKIKTYLEENRDKVTGYATKNKGLEDVKMASEESKTTIEDMRDEYIGEEWSKPDEVLEWTGFYAGGALVHWYLLQGAAKGEKDKELKKLAKESIELYTSLYVRDEKILEELGKKNVKDSSEK